jgi:hypothetical protein
VKGRYLKFIIVRDGAQLSLIYKHIIFIEFNSLSLGYRRNRVAGIWVVRLADGKGGAATKAICTADDYEDSNGATVLNYWQAQERAKSIARNSDGSGSVKPLTVRRAAEVYLETLEAKNPDCASTPESVSSAFASAAPTALRLR